MKKTTCDMGYWDSGLFTITLLLLIFEILQVALFFFFYCETVKLCGYEAHAIFCLIRVFPCHMRLCQVTWTPDTDRGRVRGFQQTTNEKLSVAEIRQRGITSLTLHYSKASHKDIQ